MRTSPDDAYVSMKKRPGAALHSSWNWELISDKPLDWWVPRIRAHQGGASRRKVLIASIMAGSGNDKELRNWQTLAEALSGERRRRARAQLLVPAHGPEGHGLQHRQGRGALLRRDRGGEGGREDSGVDASSRRRRATSSSRRRRASAAAPTRSSRRTRSRRCRSIDPETLEFEINVDGLVSSGGLGGPAILPMSLANMARMTQRVSRPRVLRHRRRLRLLAGALATSCSAAARCRCARRRCSTRRSGRT